MTLQEALKSLDAPSQDGALRLKLALMGLEDGASAAPQPNVALFEGIEPPEDIRAMPEPSGGLLREPGLPSLVQGSPMPERRLPTAEPIMPDGLFDGTLGYAPTPEAPSSVDAPGAWNITDPIRRGVAGLIRGLVPSRMGMERMRHLQETATLKNVSDALRAGEIGFTDAVLLGFAKSGHPEMVEEPLAQAEAWGDTLERAAKWVEPDPTPAPEGLAAGVDWTLEKLPGVLKSIAEMGLMKRAGLGGVGYVGRETLAGNQESREEVYRRLAEKGVPHAEAYERANAVGANLGDTALRGGLEALMVGLLGSDTPIGGVLSPYVRKGLNVAGAAGASALEAAGTSALTDMRAGDEADIEKALSAAGGAAASTGLWGLFNALAGAKALGEKQQVHHQVRDAVGRHNAAVTKRGFTPVSKKFSMGDSAAQIQAAVYSGQLPRAEARSMLIEAGYPEAEVTRLLQVGAWEPRVGGRAPDVGQGDVTPTPFASRPAPSVLSEPGRSTLPYPLPAPQRPLTMGGDMAGERPLPMGGRIEPNAPIKMPGKVEKEPVVRADLPEGYAMESGKPFSEATPEDFVLRNGSRIWGHVTEELSGGREDVPIGEVRVQAGSEDWGLRHAKKHEAEIQNKGFIGAEDFFETVFNNGTEIIPIGWGKFFEVVEKDGDRSHPSAILKWDSDNSFYTLISGFPVKTAYIKKQREKSSFLESTPPTPVPAPAPLSPETSTSEPEGSPGRRYGNDDLETTLPPQNRNVNANNLSPSASTSESGAQGIPAGARLKNGTLILDGVNRGISGLLGTYKVRANNTEGRLYFTEGVSKTPSGHYDLSADTFTFYESDDDRARLLEKQFRANAASFYEIPRAPKPSVSKPEIPDDATLKGGALRVKTKGKTVEFLVRTWERDGKRALMFGDMQETARGPEFRPVAYYSLEDKGFHLGRDKTVPGLRGLETAFRKSIRDFYTEADRLAKGANTGTSAVQPEATPPGETETPQPEEAPIPDKIPHDAKLRGGEMTVTYNGKDYAVEVKPWEKYDKRRLYLKEKENGKTVGHYDVLTGGFGNDFKDSLWVDAVKEQFSKQLGDWYEGRRTSDEAKARAASSAEQKHKSIELFPKNTALRKGAIEVEFRPGEPEKLEVVPWEKSGRRLYISEPWFHGKRGNTVMYYDTETGEFKGENRAKFSTEYREKVKAAFLENVREFRGYAPGELVPEGETEKEWRKRYSRLADVAEIALDLDEGQGFDVVKQFPEKDREGLTRWIREVDTSTDTEKSKTRVQRIMSRIRKLAEDFKAEEPGAGELEMMREPGDAPDATVRDNIRRGRAAMEKVIAEQADVMDAMHREDLGSISFLWGEPGRGPKFKGGSGVSHIIAHRNAQGYDGEAVARKMVEVIAKGELDKLDSIDKGSRAYLKYDRHTAVMSLYRDGERRTWLLTGWEDYKEKAPGEIGPVYDGLNPMLFEVTRFHPEEGAGAFDTSKPQPEEKSKSEGAEAKKEPISVMDVTRKVREMFPLRHGLGSVPRGKRRGVLGVFHQKTEVLRTKYRNNLPVIMHELGHALDKELNLRKHVPEEALTELLYAGAATSGGDYTQEQILNEGIAEFVRTYVIDRNTGRKEFPNFTPAFERALREKPETFKNFEEVRETLKAYYEQDAKARLLDKGASARKLSLETLKERAKQLGHDFYTTWVDSNHELYRVSERVREALGLEVLPDELNLYAAAQNSAGYRGAADKSAGKFLDVIQKREMTPQGRNDLEAYMKAARALDYRKNEMYPGLGTTEAEERNIVENLTPEPIKEAARELREVYEEIVQETLVNSGLMAQGTFDMLRKKWPNYVPFIRTDSEENTETDIKEFLHGYTRSLVNIGNPIKMARGVADESELLPVKDPLLHMLNNIVRYHHMAAKQGVAKVIREISRQEGCGWIAERMEGSKPHSDDSTFYIWERGKQVHYATDPAIHKVLKGLNLDSKFQRSLVGRLLSLPSKTLKMGATRYNPAFIITNALRDAGQVSITSQSWAPPLVHTIRGAMMLYNGRRGGKWKELVDEAVNEQVFYSGITDIVNSSPGGLKRALRKAFKDGGSLERLWDAFRGAAEEIGAFNEYIETAPKLYEYHHLTREKKLPKQEAARLSREVNLDFQRAGTWGKGANSVIAFFNAGVQGLDKVVRTFRERPGQSLAKAFLYITLPSILTWVLAHRNEETDEEYRQIPKWQKDLAWCVKLGEKWWRIPKPPALGQVFGSLAERALDAMFDKDPAAMRGFANTLTDQAVPNLMPTVFLPALEVYTNYSFFRDRPVVPRGKEKLPPEFQYGPGTSGLAKWVGGKTGTSPYKVDHLIRGYTGTVGGELTKMPDRFFGDGNRPREYWTEKPFIRAFFIDPYRTSESIERFYELADRTEKADNGYSARASAGYAGIPNKNIMLADVFRKERRTLSQYNQAIAAVQENKSLSPDKKRENIDRLRKAAVSIARQMVELYDHYGER